MPNAFPPLYGENIEILILGTFPSPISREKGEYYGNPRNQFWKLIFGAFNQPFENPSYEHKKDILFANGIALYDVIEKCEINGAMDSEIRNPLYRTELPSFIADNKIRKVFFNGNNAYLFYKRGIGEIEKNVLPSSSPANARIRFDEKLLIWKEKLQDAANKA